MFLKKWFGAAIQGHKMRSVDYASDLGVPRNFSMRMMNEQHAMITKVVKDLGKQDSDLRAMDVYEQYGVVLKVMYDNA